MFLDAFSEMSKNRTTEDDYFEVDDQNLSTRTAKNTVILMGCYFSRKVPLDESF